MADKFKNLKGFNGKDSQTSSIFGNLTEGISDLEQEEKSYVLEKIDVDKINLGEKNIEIDENFRKDILDLMVNPIIVSYEFTMEEKAGFPYKKKTGKYNIVSGFKRVKVYKESSEEKHKKINALVIPIDTSPEEVEIIRLKAQKEQQLSSTDVIYDVRTTENKEITYGYLYENIKIDVEKLIERDNKYAIVDDEVEALAESIYRYGLFHDIMVLPSIDKSGNIIYEIQAGHKRTRAIKLLLAKARSGQLVNGKQIIDNYSSIPAKLLPLGATLEQINAVYNESNILSRHLSVDAIFAHMDYFKCVPAVPKTQAEYDTFRGGKSINSIANDVQAEFKKIGLMDWKSRKTAGYLNIYFFGSDKLKELCVKATQDKNGNPIINIKDLEWIATTYKGFNEKNKQDEILENVLKDKNYLINLKGTARLKKSKTMKITTKEIVKKVALDKASWDNLNNANIETLKDSVEDIEKIKHLIKETKKSISQFEKIVGELENTISE